MVKDIRDIKFFYELIKLAIPVKETDLSYEEQMRLNQVRGRYDHTYSFNCAKICFIYENTPYVIPYTEEIRDILFHEKFKQRNYDVPFAEKGFPSSYQDSWSEYLKQSYITYYLKFSEETRQMYEGLRLTSELNVLTGRAIVIPIDGIPYEGENGFDRLYPLYFYHDINFEEKIGRFNQNGDTVAFVYKDGNTYLCKGKGSIKKLEEAGYRRQEKFEIPNFNQDRILDIQIMDLWRSIPEIW